MPEVWVSKFRVKYKFKVRRVGVKKSVMFWWEIVSSLYGVDCKNGRSVRFRSMKQGNLKRVYLCGYFNCKGRKMERGKGG